MNLSPDTGVRAYKHPHFNSSAQLESPTTSSTPAILRRRRSNFQSNVPSIQAWFLPLLCLVPLAGSWLIDGVPLC